MAAAKTYNKTRNSGFKVSNCKREGESEGWVGGLTVFPHMVHCVTLFIVSREEFKVLVRRVIRSVKIQFAESFCLSRSRSVQLVIFLGGWRFNSSVLHVYCSSGLHVIHKPKSSICTIGHITIARKCSYRRESRRTIKKTLVCAIKKWRDSIAKNHTNFNK